MDSAHEEVVKAPRKSFRQLIENLELAYRFGAPDELDSAINDLLANVRYDTYVFSLKNGSEMFVSRESSNPEVVFQDMLEMKNSDVISSAYLDRICGHCGNKEIITASYGPRDKTHIQFLIDNFPEEL
jgi:hypothetical protein